MNNTATTSKSHSNLLDFNLSDRLRDRLQLAFRETGAPFSATLYANIARRL